MTDLDIMDYQRKKKTVLRNVEKSNAEQIDIRIAFGDELADVTYSSGQVETFDSCPDNEERTADKIEGQYTLYTKGHIWPDAWDKRHDAYEGEKIMTAK